jgi:hypothetical protein
MLGLLVYLFGALPLIWKKFEGSTGKDLIETVMGQKVFNE